MYKPYEPDYDHKREVCLKCKYAKSFNHNIASIRLGYVSDVYCDYLLMTGSMRPCPAAECTVFEQRTVKKHKRGPGIVI